MFDQESQYGANVGEGNVRPFQGYQDLPLSKGVCVPVGDKIKNFLNAPHPHSHLKISLIARKNSLKLHFLKIFRAPL